MPWIFEQEDQEEKGRRGCGGYFQGLKLSKLPHAENYAARYKTRRLTRGSEEPAFTLYRRGLENTGRLFAQSYSRSRIAARCQDHCCGQKSECTCTILIHAILVPDKHQSPYRSMLLDRHWCLLLFTVQNENEPRLPGSMSPMYIRPRVVAVWPCSGSPSIHHQSINQ